MDSETLSLLSAAREFFAAHGFRVADVVALAGDVSPRRYARATLAGGGTMLAVFYPAEVAASADRFVAARALLADAGVRVPRILVASPASPWMAIEDLGGETLYDRRARPWRELLPELLAAAGAARRIRALSAGAVVALGSAPLDERLLRQELEQTLEIFLRPRGLSGDVASDARLSRALDELCARLAAAAPFPAHRDFMARNLIPVARGAVAVIDFQDLRLAPAAYDVASLANDSLYAPPEIERDLAAEAGLDARSDDYARAVAQRTLKIVGTFARFAARGVDRYLPLVAPSLERALARLETLPETAAAVAPLAGAWREAIVRNRFC